MTKSLTTETLVADRLPYVYWLSMQHESGGSYYDLAHLVLSGGPDSLWMGRFDLTPHMVYKDIQLLYAAAKPGVTSDHVELARTACDQYYEHAPTVAEAVTTRHNTEGGEAVNNTLRRPFNQGFSSQEWSSDRSAPHPSEIAPAVTDADGNDVAYTDDSLPMVRTTRHCTHVDPDTRVPCFEQTPPGNNVCTRHGGRLYTDVELKNIHRTTKEKLLAASDQAVDGLVNLLNSTSDMVRLKAAEAILDRTGFVGGVEIQVAQSGPDQSPAQVIEERLARLSQSESHTVEQLPSQDAQVVEDEE